MAPKTFNEWIEHGWWLVATDANAPILWITKRPMQEGQYWGAFGHEFGKMQSITTAPQDVIFMNVAIEDEEVRKYKLQRQLMMAPTMLSRCC